MRSTRRSHVWESLHRETIYKDAQLSTRLLYYFLFNTVDFHLIFLLILKKKTWIRFPSKFYPYPRGSSIIFSQWIYACIWIVDDSWIFLQNSRRGSRLRGSSSNSLAGTEGYVDHAVTPGKRWKRWGGSWRRESLASLAKSHERSSYREGRWKRGRRLERRGSITSLCVFCDCIPLVEDKYSHVELEITGRLLRSLPTCALSLLFFARVKKRLASVVMAFFLFFERKSAERTSYFPFICFSLLLPLLFFSFFCLVRRFID